MKRRFTPLYSTLLFTTLKKRCNLFTYIVLVATLLIGVSQQAIAQQPTVLGTPLVNGTYATYDMVATGGFRQVRMQATSNASAGTLNWLFVTGTAGSPNYSAGIWRPYTSGLSLAGYNLHIPPVGGTSSALYNTGSGGQDGLLPAVTAGNYYTVNVSNNAGANNNMSVLETTYNPENILSVTRSPATVGAIVTPTITVTMSSAPVSNVYVRYSTNAGFTTSTILQLSFAGATGTATIPVQAAGTTVYYYVYSSTRTKTAIDNDVITYGQGVHDMATLNLNNNAGANYSYSVLPVTVNATNVANDASYATLATAFAAINAGTHTGAINVWVGGNTTEAVSAVLNASGAPSSYTAITVRPVGVRTITGNLAAPIVDLNGADNVTIDGLNDGTNSLGISNSNTSNTAGTSTMRLYNGATADIVQNCIIEGSTTNTASGIIFLSTGINSTITIASNTIRPVGVNFPVYSVFASGTSNTAISVTGNNIQDYFSATVNSAGIYAGAGSNTWTVSSNRLYQSVARTVTTAGVIVRAIQVTTGGGHTISNNIIGFATNGGGGTSTYTTTQTNNQVIAIELAGNATVSSIQGNSVSGISITSASNLTTATAPGIFAGIYVSSGAANIGTVVGNTIGLTTGTTSISITCSFAGIQLFATGIYTTSLSPNIVNIQNNNVGSIRLTSATAAVQYNFNAVYIPNTATAAFSIVDNFIGSASTAGSVTVGVSSTSITNFTAFSYSGSGTISAIGNNIQNCIVSGTGASILTGINIASGSGAISVSANNIISCSNAGTGAFTAITNAATATTLTISDNVIRSNSISSATGTFNGIVNAGAVTTAITINDNKLGNASGGLINYSVANSGLLYGINNTAGASTAVLAIQGNNFQGITHSVAGSSNHLYINNTAATLSQNISTNTFTNLSVATSGGITFISNSVTLGASGTKTVIDNAVVGSFAKTAAGSNIYFYLDNGSSATGAAILNDNNNFSNITITGATALQGWVNGDGVGNNPSKNITNNTFRNITAATSTAVILPLQVTNGTGNISGNTINTCSGQGTVTGLTVTLGSFSVFSNIINTLSSSGAAAAVTGISIAGGTTHNVYYHTLFAITSSGTSAIVSGINVTLGTTVNIYKNKIYGLSNSVALASGGVYGINVTGGTTITLSNNTIGTLTANLATFDDAVRGVSIGGGTTVNAYYNTVFLNATSGGTNFGSSALYANTTSVVNLRNNIFINNSTPFGTGRTVVYRRGGTSLTNYAAASNNNLYFAVSPAANRLIFFDGTNTDITLAAFQTRVTPRDVASVTASLTFVSTTGSSPNFLHLNTTSLAESGAAPIAGFTDDYDDEIRNVTTPDIGADEFVSIVCPATPTVSGISTAAPYYAGDVITITGTNLSGITYATINNINATIGITTATTAQLTIPVTMSDSVGVIEVAASSSCTFSNTFNFVFAGYITKGAGTGSGTWGTATIWRNNALPVANAPATINNGDAVTLNVSADPIKFTINSTATFTQATNNAFIFGATHLNNTTVNGTLVIDNGSVLTSTDRFISPKLIVTNGGIFTNNAANAQAVNIANLYINSGGSYTHNATGSSLLGVLTDFPGSSSRTFGATSNVTVLKWANGGAGAINLPASGTPGWGNLTINVASLGGSWNQTGNLTNVQGNLNILATGGASYEFRLTGVATNATTIGGNLVVSGGILVGTSGTGASTITLPTGNIVVSGGILTGNTSGGSSAINVTLGNVTISGGTIIGRSGSGAYTLTVGGAMTASSGTYTPTSSSGATGTTTVTGAFTASGATVTSPGSGQVNVFSLGSLVVSSGLFGMSASSSSSLDITSGSVVISGTGRMLSTSTGSIVINCTGNFSSTSTAATAFVFQDGSSSSKIYTLNLGGNFSITGTGLFVGGSASSPASINFTGGAASVTYTASPTVMAVSSPVNVKNNFIVTSGKTLLLNSNITPASSSTSNNWNVTVNTGATLDCSTREIGTNSATQRTGFTLQTGATLITANVGGVFSTTPGAASITTTAALASFHAGATYVFNGVAAQVTSSFATTPAATPSNIANLVINNSTGVTLSDSYNVTAALQMQTGNLTLSTFNLTTATITGAPFSNTKMVVTNSNGALGQPVSLTTILYPVGNSGNYTPASYTFTANSTARYLNVRAVTPRNANDVSLTDYINNRWWNTDLSVTTGTYTYTAVYTYISGDMIGTAANIRLNRWNGSAWINDAASVVNNTNFTISSGTLNQVTGTLSATAEWVGRVYTAPAIYHWTNTVNGTWLDPARWTPTGVPGSGDGVIFDAVGGSPYTVTNMPTTISLSQLTVSNNNVFNLSASGASNVTMIAPGTATPQFSIAAGSSMTIDGTSAVTLTLPAAATGNISGSLNMQRAAHRVLVNTAGALVVPSGGYFSYGNTSLIGFTGNPFGPTGTNGAVVFQNGSVCECFEGSNPFGSTIADAITIFQSGSLFRYSDPSVSLPSVSGRTYSNFTYNANKVSSLAAANTFICDSLTVNLGTLNLNLQGTPTPDHSIRGNINALTGATLSFTPGAAGTVNMNSGATQIIWGAGTFNVNALSTFDINAGTTVSLQKNMGVNSTGNVLVNGTFIFTGENYINTPTIAGGTVTLNNGGTLSIQSVNGINNTLATGNVRSTNFTYNAGGNFIYSGTANQVTGNRLPVTLSGTPLSQLTIANTGTVPNNVVTLTTNNTTTARINLNAGQFNAGTGGTLILNGGTNLVVDGGGDQFLSGSATDNIIRFAGNGAVQGTPELWNVTIGTSGSGVDFQNNARINGILLVNSGGFVVNNAPNYNTGSFLIYNTGGAYNRNIEWSSNAGVGTPAYPHHVTIQNATTLDVQNPAFDLGCGGNLSLGTTTAGTLVLSSYTQPYDLFVKGNINIGSTAAGTLTMSNSVGCDLYLTGNWTRNAIGVVNFGGGNGRSVYFDGSNDATITATGGQYFPYLRMTKTAKANKVTLADHVNIGFEATFTRGTLDIGTNNKFFTILSNASYDGRVDVSDSANTDFIYGSGDVTGQFIVQRYFPAQRKWRLLNAPLKPGGGSHSISQAWQERGNGATGLDYTAANWAASVATDTTGANYGLQITGGTTANGFDQSPNNNTSIRFYSGGVWNTPATTNSTGINSQEGWLVFVRGDRETYGEITNQYKTPTVTTLRPRGQIFIGQKTITASGVQTVGNPYASAVDYFTMTRTGTGWPANPTYYVWDPFLGGAFGVGAWVTLTWNGTNFSRSSPYGAGNYDNRYIPSGAAIMVEFPAGGGTLSMNETNKNTDSTTTAFRPVRQLMTSLQTKDSDGSVYVADGALNLFGDNFNNAADLDDARKFTNINENIGLKRNAGYLSIERKQLNADADTIFYALSKMQRKAYQFKFEMDHLNLPLSTNAFLEDTYLKKKMPVSITGSSLVDFSVTAEAGSAAAERFRLVFRRAVTYTSVDAAISNSDVVVSWNVNSEWNLDRYEIERSVNGTDFSKIADQVSKGESDVPVNYNSFDASPLPGEYYYRIKSVSKDGAVVYSDVVKVKVVKATPALYVFPNPVTNGIIQLQLNTAIAGTYSTVLYGNNGQAINNWIINHAGGTSTKTIQPKQPLTSGTYQLKITAPGNKVTIIKVVVVN